MQLVRAAILLTVSPFLACRPAATTGGRACGAPPPPPVPPHNTISQGRIIDTAYVRSGLARVVFRVRSAGPTNPGKVLRTPLVLLRDSLGANRTQRRSIGDSTGLAVVDSVPPRYTTAQILALGYVSRTFSIAVRRGHTDTIDVTLAEDRLCLANARSAFAWRLQS